MPTIIKIRKPKLNYSFEYLSKKLKNKTVELNDDELLSLMNSFLYLYKEFKNQEGI